MLENELDCSLSLFEKNKLKINKRTGIRKSVNFGEICLTSETVGVTEDNLPEVLRGRIASLFKEKDEIIFENFYDANLDSVINKDKLIFTKINFDNEHFFGNLTKETTEKDILTDVKSKELNEILNPDELIFEHNTLFYIDFKTCSTSFIKTRNIMNVYPIIKTLLTYNTVYNIDVIPFKKSDTEIINSQINKIEMSFVDKNCRYKGLNEIDELGCDITNYTFNLQVIQKSKNFSEKFLDLIRKKDKSELKRVSISTQNEDIDLLTNLFTKQVSIILDKDYKENFVTIENTLSVQLFEAVQA